MLAQYQLCNKVSLYYFLTDKQILHQWHCLSHVNSLSVNSSLSWDSYITYGPCDYQGMDFTSKVPEDMWKQIYHKFLIHLTFSGVTFNHSSQFIIICKLGESSFSPLTKIIQVIIYINETSLLQAFSSLC